MTATPQLLAAGRPATRAYQHVGYVVGGHDAFTVRRSEAGAHSLVLLGLLAFAMALLPRRGARLQLRSALLVAAVVLWGVGLHRAGRQAYVPRPGTIEGLLQLERLAAATEAQAMALGRWPTQLEWHRAHGHPTGRDGRPIEYAVGGPPPPAAKGPTDQSWQVYGLWCGDQAAAPLDPIWLDSRLFGADGLFGTDDDDPQLRFMQPRFYRRAAWPHARAPRDPSAKLPPAKAITRR